MVRAPLAADSPGQHRRSEHSLPHQPPESPALFSPVNCFRGAKTLRTRTRHKYNAKLATVVQERTKEMLK